MSLLPPATSSPPPSWPPSPEDGIIRSAPDGRLRLSPHWPNAHDEVELVVADALRKAVC